MDDTLPRQFFVQPACPAQRQYEALRAVFVEGLSQKEAAERFGYSPGAFRLLVAQFRASIAAGNPPPFLLPNDADDPLPLARPLGPRSQPSLTPEP